MKTAEEIQDDIERLNSGDPEIDREYEKLRRLFKDKGIPYRELMKSKFFGTIKYLLVELQDDQGTVLITDLDSNNTYRFVDRHQIRKIDPVKQWIRDMQKR